MLRIFVVSLLSMLCGCAGVVVSSNQWVLAYADINGRLPSIYVGGERGNFSTGNAAPSVPITDDWMIKKWGDPDKMIITGNEVTYCYRAGVRMSGAIVGIGIMVPLIVPTGEKQYYFTFRNGVLASARFEHPVQKGEVVGLPSHM